MSSETSRTASGLQPMFGDVASLVVVVATVGAAATFDDSRQSVEVEEGVEDDAEASDSDDASVEA